MNLYQHRSNIKLLAERFRLSKDARLYNSHIDFLISQHRATGIREEFGRNMYIDPTWLQDFGQTDVTPVNSGDDPAIQYTSKKLGKVTLPAVVSLPLDKGVYRIAHSSKLMRYYYIEADRFFSLVSGSVTTEFPYYFRVGQAFYVSPCTDRINPTLILENPLDGYVLNTERVSQDSLTVGESYTVYDTQIIHSSVAYFPGNTFTAVNKNYSGAGHVMFTNMKRRMTDLDPYPMGQKLAEYVTMKIFTVDFQLAKQDVADVISDSQEQKIIQTQ